MKIRRFSSSILWLTAVILLIALPRTACAEPDPRVDIRAWVEPGKKVAATQQLRYVIELSTPAWFSGGTRIRPPELPDAIVKQAGQFATNFTKNVDGHTWSVQQWTFFIHPLKEKDYRIPAHPVWVATAGPEGSETPKLLHAPPVRFSAVIPPPLIDVKNWIAAPRFTVAEEYQGKKDTYTVGDAIERRIVLEAEDLPGMMLPAVVDDIAPGLAVYEDPPRTVDDINRGRITGRRIERMTYIVEKPGRYRIPSRTYSWYNIDTGSLEEIKLSEKYVATHGFQALPASGKAPGPMSPHAFVLLAATVTGLMVLVLLVMRWMRKKTKGTRAQSAKTLKRNFKKALRSGNKDLAGAMLYHWFDRYGNPDGGYTHWRQLLASLGVPEKRAVFETCMQHLFGPDQAAGSPPKPPIKKLAGLMDRRAIKKRSSDKSGRWLKKKKPWQTLFRNVG